MYQTKPLASPPTDDLTILFPSFLSIISILLFSSLSLSLSPPILQYEDHFFLTSTQDFNIHLWNYKASKLIRSFKGHKGKLKTLFVSVAESVPILYSGASDNTVRKWNIKVRTIYPSLSILKYRYLHNLDYPNHSICFSS